MGLISDSMDMIFNVAMAMTIWWIQTIGGGGFINRYHYESGVPFLSNFQFDIVPYQSCCVYPTLRSTAGAISFNGCSKFFLEKTT